LGSMCLKDERLTLGRLGQVFKRFLRGCSAPYSRIRNRVRRAAVFAATVVCVPATGMAQTTPDPLAGVKNFHVVVENIDQSSARLANLTPDRLRTIAELKLRVAGIQVLSSDESYRSQLTPPYLYVNLNLLSVSGPNEFVYSINVSLRRYAASPINGADAVVLLWEKGLVAIAGERRMPRAAEESLDDLMDEFVNSYLAANPKH
jgi:hypothetical protein